MADLGPLLLQLARAAITSRLGTPTAVPFDVHQIPELGEPGATFVTLMQDGNLRGCIGSLTAYRPLVDDVRENACKAAFRDPRFRPLSREELAKTQVEVSLICPPEPIQFKDEQDALIQLRPGVDGIVLSAQGRTATFLPQVWEQLPNPVDFLSHLKVKAGLPADYWGADVKIERYEVRKWKETEEQHP